MEENELQAHRFQKKNKNKFASENETEQKKRKRKKIEKRREKVKGKGKFSPSLKLAAFCNLVSAVRERLKDSIPWTESTKHPTRKQTKETMQDEKSPCLVWLLPQVKSTLHPLQRNQVRRHLDSQPAVIIPSHHPMIRHQFSCLIKSRDRKA